MTFTDRQAETIRPDAGGSQMHTMTIVGTTETRVPAPRLPCCWPRCWPGGCATGEPKPETAPTAGGAGRELGEATRVMPTSAPILTRRWRCCRPGTSNGHGAAHPGERARPNSTARYINLAIAQQDLGKFEAAEENLKKALAIAPEHPVANNEYGILYRRTGRFAEARKTYEAVLKKDVAFSAGTAQPGDPVRPVLKDYDCALEN